MQRYDRDTTFLWDMARAIQRLQGFAEESSLEAYLASIFSQSAVERQFEVLGEAARRISSAFQQAHPEIDWSNIIGLRNVIAHQYEQVDQEKLWTTIKNNLPDLLMKVEALLPPLLDEG
jgi:uncharacterized protein with HEPN domain